MFPILLFSFPIFSSLPFCKHAFMEHKNLHYYTIILSLMLICSEDAMCEFLAVSIFCIHLWHLLVVEELYYALISL